MIVPLRPFGTAVRRNYARRRLREFYRRNRELFPGGYDILVRLFRAPRDWDRFLRHVAELAARIPQRNEDRQNDEQNGRHES